jgi:hypothetical protein
VFNALRSDELLLGIAQVLRLAADSRTTLEEYERSQLLSAFSVSRLLAAEQRGQVELLAWTQTELDGALAQPADGPVAVARTRIADAATGVAVGEALADLLAELPPDDPARPPVRRILRELADREIDALEAVA